VDPYEAAVAALQARGRFGIRLGLGRTRALLHELGDPHLALRGPLIAGTNGKGSVQAMVAAMLRAAGYRTGQTPKPHLVEYRERILVGGESIAPADFAAVVADALGAADRIARRLGEPTEFELLTAASLAWLARARVDVAVIEVGLGGRLDATNAWDGGVAAITNVDWDHMDRLGPTLTAIAREKAAIVKRGDRAVSGVTGEGRPVVRRRAARLNVPLVEPAPLPVAGLDRTGLWVEHPELGQFRLGLLGRHQAVNASVALAIVEALDDAGIATLPASARRDGLARVRWPGRLELLTLGIPRDEPQAPGAADPVANPTSPTVTPAGPAAPAAPHAHGGPFDGFAGVEVLLDGAHNAAGVDSLLAALGDLRPFVAGGRLTLLLGLMGDKDVAAIVQRLARSPLLAAARIIATRVETSRALPAGDVQAAWLAVDRVAEVTVVDTSEAALGAALAAARESGGLLVVAGSLYLVGAVRGRLDAAGLIR
jgi:dihydrofolate synthase/folylpolyglutamate synthase